MEIVFAAKNEITQKQQKMLNEIERICFGFSAITIIENKDIGHLFGADELGVVLLLDGERIVGNAYLYKRISEYNGKEYCLGGPGGLAVLPEYRGKGYARLLMEKTLELAHDVGVDVACLFTEREDTVHKLYEKFGFVYLNRKGYYVDSLQKEAYRDDIMIMGLKDKALARKILSTGHKFHYGKEEGCW